jgi:deoxyribose-phosphate aldolase
VKASAGVRTAAFALELVEAGATRIGTSASIAIMEEWKRLR